MLLNRNRNTIQKWLDQRCPFVTKADRDRGIAWELDIADVVKWLEERAAKSVAEKFGDRITRHQKKEVIAYLSRWQNDTARIKERIG